MCRNIIFIISYSKNLDFTTFGLDYSLDEQTTAFKWVDGKPIYKKTINCGALPNNTRKEVAHNISNLDYVIKIEGTTSNTSSPFFNPIPLVYGNNTAAYNTEFAVNRTSVIMVNNNDRSMLDTYVTLYYTKAN